MSFTFPISDPAEVLKLHYDSNIYVSSSRGEAWNLGAYDAKVAGNRMVCVGFGGPIDFSGSSDAIIYGLSLELAPEEYQWEPGAKWSSLPIDRLSEALRSVQAPERFERPAGLEAFEMGPVGALMRERVEHVLARARELA